MTTHATGDALPRAARQTSARDERPADQLNQDLGCEDGHARPCYAWIMPDGRKAPSDAPAYAGEAAGAVAAAAVAANRRPRRTSEIPRAAAHGIVTKSRIGKLVSARLANGPTAASQVAAINGAENVRSLRAAIATDESQMSKARLARKNAAFMRRDPPCTTARCMAMSAPVAARSLAANPRAAPMAAPVEHEARAGDDADARGSSPDDRFIAPDETPQADGHDDQGRAHQGEADGSDIAGESIGDHLVGCLVADAGCWPEDRQHHVADERADVDDREGDCGPAGRACRCGHCFSPCALGEPHRVVHPKRSGSHSRSERVEPSRPARRVGDGNVLPSHQAEQRTRGIDGMLTRG